MDLAEFFRRFGTEKKCIHFLKLQRERIGIQCPNCQQTVNNWRPKHNYWRCSCGRKISLKSGTLMQSSKVPYRAWFKAIFLMTHVKKSYSILELSRLLGIKRYRTVWYLSMKIRMAMGDEVLAKEYFQFLTLLSKDKSHPSQLKAIQNYSITAIFKSPSNSRDEINLIAPLKIQQNVNTVEHSLIKSGYRCLKIFNAQKKIEMKEPHFPVKTKIKNWLNYIISNKNRNLNGIHHGVSFLHLQKYLFEYSFNYNLRYQNKFKILMKRVLS